MSKKEEITIATFVRNKKYPAITHFLKLVVLIYLCQQQVNSFPCQTPDEWLSGNISVQHPSGVSPPKLELSPKWPNGVIKYKFNDTLTSTDKTEVSKAFEEFHRKTCIRFQPWEEGDNDFVSIEVDDNICGKANVCKIGGYQYARFGGKCRNTVTMIHQLAHTLCLGHEHQRLDRDEYINFRNCTQRSQKVASIVARGIYDYWSRMHPNCGSCEGGWPTTSEVTCGRPAHSGLSVLDADAINSFYDCKGCHRHRWISQELLTLDKESIQLFGYSTKNGSPLYACRAPIVEEVAGGTYDESWNSCNISWKNSTQITTRNVEVFTIPGGLEDGCSTYKFISKDEALVYSNVVKIGEMFRVKDCINHLAYGYAISSDGSHSYYFGKVWNVREQGFKFHTAELPFGPMEFSPSSNDHSFKNYEVLVCTIDTNCVQNIVYIPPINNNEQKLQSKVIVLNVVVLVLILLLALATCFYCFRIKKLKALLSDTEVKQFWEGKFCHRNKDGVPENEGDDADEKRFRKEFELTREEISMDIKNTLGNGAFGIVYKGTAKGIPAAIKIPNEGCTPAIFKSFLSEVTVLSYLGAHINILGFIGAYVGQIQYGILHIATELCSNGSLESFLRKKKHVLSQTIPQKDLQGVESVMLYELHRFAFDIANGMEYIASKNVVHGDLSTRNVFLDAENICKIGDFGLSRKLDEYNLYVKHSQEPMPWKWLAYESLTKMEFTCKSDVWGYGVTVWEIFSLGNTPYAGLTWTPEFTNEIEKGLRLPLPTYASPEIYAKLLECWNLDSDQRTTCTELVEFFKKFWNNEYITLEEKIEEGAKDVPQSNMKLLHLNSYLETPI